MGGWGPMLGDPASGAWPGRKLLGALAEGRGGLRAGSGLLEHTFAGLDREDSNLTAFAAGARPDRRRVSGAPPPSRPPPATSPSATRHFSSPWRAGPPITSQPV